MAKRRKQKTARGSTSEDQGSGGFGGLGALLQAQGLQASVAVEETPDSSPPTPVAIDDPVPAAQRWILRRSRKGRGGREATLLEPRGLTDDVDLRPLAKRLRRELGCGASVEGEGVAVQGDQRERLQGWLEANGARKVTLG